VMHVYGTGMKRDADRIFGTFWRWVYLAIRPDAAVAQSEYIGHVNTDYSVLGFADLLALRQWHQIDPVDGKADLYLWGRDADTAARELGVPRLSPSGHGWRDLPSDEAEKRDEELDELCRRSGLLVRVAASNHSHFHYMNSAMDEPGTQSGTLTVAGARICAFRTGISGRSFPVIRDLDAEGRLVRIRVLLEADTPTERAANAIRVSETKIL
jgi:hypothetical protein